MIDTPAEAPATTVTPAAESETVIDPAQQFYDTYERQHHLRLANTISAFLVLLLSGATIVGALMLLMQGSFVMYPLQAFLFVALGLGLSAASGYAYQMAQKQHLHWATGIVTGVSIISTSLLVLFSNSVALRPDTFQVEFFALNVTIVVVGLLGSIVWIAATVVLLNLFTIAASLVIIPHLSAQQPAVSPTFILLVIIIQWVLAVLMTAGRWNHQQTIRDLRDAEIAFKRAQQLDDLKDQFISSVNHELRNPLMAMMNYVAVLRQRHDAMTPSRREQVIVSLESTGKRVIQLVGSVLDARQITQHPEDFTAGVVPIKSMLMTASTLLDPAEARMTERELHVHIPEQLEIWGNDVYVQQIFTNLLSNAVKYSDPGTPIEVQAHAVIDRTVTRGKQIHRRSMVEITVRDYGLGIPPAQAPLLFNRFVRLSRDLTSSTIGNGLGLYLCKMLAEAMGGQIWIESTGVEGQGSTFHLVLPSEPDVDTLQSATTAPRLAVVQRRSVERRVRIVLGGALAALLIVSSVAFIAQRQGGATAKMVGTVHYFDTASGNSTGVNITVSNLATPPAGSHYQAWLINGTNEQVLSLGGLSLHGNAYTLQYQTDVNLVGVGTLVEITQEHSQNQVPLGKVLLFNAFPPNAFIHIGHLLVAFPTTPQKKGLLVGLVEQTKLLDTQAHQLQATGTQNPALSHCLTLAMTATIEGLHGAHYQALPDTCTAMSVISGDGFGLLPNATVAGSGYITDTANHAALARQQTDATSAIKAHGAKIISNMNALTSLTMTLDADITQLTDASTPAQLTAIVTLADAIYSPSLTAKSGAQYAYTEGQLLADLPLTTSGQ